MTPDEHFEKRLKQAEELLTTARLTDAHRLLVSIRKLPCFPINDEDIAQIKHEIDHILGRTSEGG